ncbi:MAG: SGNH/GDSL hydrolase family protein [Chitinophagaceae bacterium]
MRFFFPTLLLLIVICSASASLLNANDTLILLSNQIKIGYNLKDVLLSNSPPSITSSNSSISLPTNTATLTSNTIAVNSIISTKWTKFKSPGQSAKRIVFLGSSTTVGTGASTQNNSFVGRIINYYTSQGLCNSVSTTHNRGLGGATVFAAMPTGYTPTSGNQQAPDPLRNVTWALTTGGADIVLVNFPSNGYSQPGGLTITEIMFAYRTIFNTVINAGKKCFITTTQPRGDFSTSGKLFLQQVRDSILLQFGSYAIDFYTPLATPGSTTLDPEYSFGDNIHFNDAGHLQLFNRVVAVNMFEGFANSPASIITPNNVNTIITSLTHVEHKFQVSVIDSRGLAASSVSTISVNPCSGNSNTWLGVISTDWGIPSNWSCGTVPGVNTEVFINQGISFSPIINSNVTVKSVTISNGMQLIVNPGFHLKITGK